MEMKQELLEKLNAVAAQEQNRIVAGIMKCTSIEEIKAYAKHKGIEISDSDAAELYSSLNAPRELSDDELMTVSGGTKPPKSTGEKKEEEEDEDTVICMNCMGSGDVELGHLMGWGSCPTCNGTGRVGR